MNAFDYQREVKRAARTRLEDTFAFQLRAMHLGGEGPEGWQREYVFAPPRKWRFDFAFVDRLLAVEIEGGTWTGGRHTRGAGFENDCEKYAEAILRGWRVFRFTADMVTDWRGIKYVFDWMNKERK